MRPLWTKTLLISALTVLPFSSNSEEVDGCGLGELCATSNSKKEITLKDFEGEFFHCPKTHAPKGKELPNATAREARRALNKIFKNGSLAGKKIWLYQPCRGKTAQIKVGEFIAEGGTKSIYDLDGGLALALPNRLDGLASYKRWARIVEDEVFASQKIASESGVNTLPLEKRYLVLNINGFEKKFPTYVAPHFKVFEKTRIYVVDRKTKISTTWRAEYREKNWRKKSDPYAKESWPALLSALKGDVARLSQRRIYLGQDSLNLLICKRGSFCHLGGPYLYEPRLFAFDFANKGRRLNWKVRHHLFGPSYKKAMEADLVRIAVKELLPVGEKSRAQRDRLTQEILKAYFGH